MVHPYPRLCPAFDYVGRVSYFVTFKTHDRQTLFRDDGIVDLVLRQCRRAAEERGFDVLAFCFMPEHLHLVVRGRLDTSDAKAFFRLTKQYSGFYFAKQHEGRRLWQRYGHDRIIRDDVELLDRLRYVVRNPVAAGLVDRPEDYPFWGSFRWTREDLLKICEQGLREAPQSEKLQL